MSESNAAKSLFRTVSEIVVPWGVVFYVWWVGLHWTIIGLAALYGAMLLMALGAALSEIRRDDA